jgi:hypothetical protein
MLDSAPGPGNLGGLGLHEVLAVGTARRSNFEAQHGGIEPNNFVRARSGERSIFYLSERRNVNAAKHFFRKAMKSVGTPHRAVRELKAEGCLPRRVRVRRAGTSII